MRDVLTTGLDLVICGTAASSVSAQRGQYYAGPGNRFWTILWETGLTDRLLEPPEYGSLLDYRIGLTDFQNVRDMEGTLTLQQDAFAESEGQVVQNLIELYRALGGGWEPDPDELVREIEDQKNGEPVL